MKKVMLFFVISMFFACNSSVKKSNDSIPVVIISNLVNIKGVNFELFYNTENYARIVCDSMVLDTSILNKVLDTLKITVSPVYFHIPDLKETGEEFASAFNGRTLVYENPPRNKEDVKSNLYALELISAITECDLILKDKSITIESANSYIESLATAIELLDKKDIKLNNKISTLKVKLKNKVISTQIYLYPKARKAYTTELANKMWEENIVVKSSGTTITLIGGIFASNKNKKDALDAIYPILYKFRFKRANFKWIEHDDEYTYWNVDSPTDNKIQ